MTVSDNLLLERLSQSDDSAFEELFLRYYEKVYRVLYNLLGTREEAEDLAQETFLTLYHHPPRASESSNLSAWLCRVATNRGYNALRSRQRARQRMAHLYGSSSLETNDPYHEAVRAEERNFAQTILARLPERQSKLLLLRYAGLSYAEIAAALEIAPGSVGTLLVRAERAFASKCHEPVASTV